MNILDGVRVLEVAEQTFVPAASGLLADWGAEVIKIEHVERGDAMRGLAATGVIDMPSDVHALFEHSNRGKKSLGLDLTQPEGLDVLYKLAATADVFITNKLGPVRRKLSVDLDDIRAHNDKIIYVRGSGQGERGPDADKGAYDQLAFWARAGIALGSKRPENPLMPTAPGPGFGDSIGAMTIAGGVLGALFHRERTGEATEVDVSLFGTGLWANGQTIALSLTVDKPFEQPAQERPGQNPLSRYYETSDGRTLSLCALQAGKYWPSMCQVIGRPELATDPRFADHRALLTYSVDAVAILEDAFGSAPLEEWRKRLEDFTGQWSVVQNTLEAAADPQSVANGYLQSSSTAKGTPFQLVASPVQFGGQPSPVTRAPEFNEHGDEILTGLGMEYDAIIDLKVKGVVA